MDDRELLEKAARAAGYVVDWSVWDYTGLGVEDDESETGRIMPALNGAEWNPLTDDGDALRLAVKLRLEVWIHESYTRVVEGNMHAELCQHGIDPYAATRRAIVRAAASMGEN